MRSCYSFFFCVIVFHTFFVHLQRVTITIFEGFHDQSWELTLKAAAAAKKSWRWTWERIQICNCWWQSFVQSKKKLTIGIEHRVQSSAELELRSGDNRDKAPQLGGKGLLGTKTKQSGKNCTYLSAMHSHCLKINPKMIFFSTLSRCMKITEKVSFNTASEASYVFILVDKS